MNHISRWFQPLLSGCSYFEQYLQNFIVFEIMQKINCSTLKPQFPLLIYNPIILILIAFYLSNHHVSMNLY